MQIGGVMRVRLVTADPGETAADAIRRMLDANVGSVVVCEGTVPVGILRSATSSAWRATAPTSRRPSCAKR